MRTNIVMIMLMVVAATPSASVTLPHTFQSNTPALAQQVNANFEALVAAIDAVTPVGSVQAFAGPASAVPIGWLLCDGRQLDPDTHPDLYSVIGDAHGGDGGFSFRLPDYRGRFLRGVDSGAGQDPDGGNRIAVATGGNTGDAVGTLQFQSFEAHSHNTGGHGHFTNSGGVHTHAVGTGSNVTPTLISINDDGEGTGVNSVDGSFRTDGPTIRAFEGGSTHTHSVRSSFAQVGDPSSGSFGAETRPVNVSVNYIIRCGSADAC